MADVVPVVEEEVEETPRVYTKEEVENRLRGQGKELAKLKAELDAVTAARQEAEQKKLEEQGKFKEIAEQQAAELKALKEQNGQYAEREVKRLEAVAAKNTKRIEALPKDLRDLPPVSLPPEDLHSWLDNFEAKVLAKGGKIVVSSGDRGPRPENDATFDDELIKKGINFLMPKTAGK